MLKLISDQKNITVENSGGEISELLVELMFLIEQTLTSFGMSTTGKTNFLHAVKLHIIADERKKELQKKVKQDLKK